ncbi:DUF1697 domain-containing protein [Propionimicrobium sp. PCR01-08-3]|uniref:DUF1697 domain-containing protein n=1 Tax=Propionimicrobium sp. PCR01-08-3 TaxID=3052086 RepID=UPI00255D12D9|nr:DUF1697 domain-containing protein [Propionimicrobium sp. PCR01-08-3]WIY82235.1 DUF1697 domain-containing protein [Propionimicrobium sp. PCR01-08-3]
MEHAALLRGVNVEGITIRSADLKGLFVGLGFEDVRTYLASGNARFTSDAADRAELKATIERALTARFGYEAWSVLVTLDELRRARDELPFDPADTTHNSYVIFGADGATRDALMQKYHDLPHGEDCVLPGPGVIYWNVPVTDTTSSPFGKELGRTAWKRTTTNRNIRTVSRITV